MGFITLIIAQNLALDGDTMEMMRAVLDTNFWLATHVVAVTARLRQHVCGGIPGADLHSARRVHQNPGSKPRANRWPG